LREQVALSSRLGRHLCPPLAVGSKDVVEILADAVARRRNSGHKVIVVSSGAISTGMPALGLTKRPKDLPTQQAAASVGQGILLAAYTAAFASTTSRLGRSS